MLQKEASATGVRTEPETQQPKPTQLKLLELRTLDSAAHIVCQKGEVFVTISGPKTRAIECWDALKAGLNARDRKPTPEPHSDSTCGALPA
jgi:hypothetical protein